MAVRYEGVDIQKHLDGICDLVEETLSFRHPDIIRLLHHNCPDGLQVALVADNIIGKTNFSCLSERRPKRIESHLCLCSGWHLTCNYVLIRAHK